MDSAAQVLPSVSEALEPGILSVVFMPFPGRRKRTGERSSMNFLKEILGDGFAAFETAVKAWNEKPENKDRQVKIINASSGDYISKSEYEALEMSKKGLETQLQTATDNLRKFEGIEDPAKLQGEIVKLQGELKTQKAAYEGQIADMQFNAALESAITTAGGRNAKAIKALLDADSLKTSKDRTADIKAAIEICQKDNPYLFGTNEPINHPVGPTGGSAGGIDSNTAALRAAMGLPAEESK